MMRTGLAHTGGELMSGIPAGGGHLGGHLRILLISTVGPQVCISIPTFPDLSDSCLVITTGISNRFPQTWHVWKWVFVSTKLPSLLPSPTRIFTGHWKASDISAPWLLFFSWLQSPWFYLQNASCVLSLLTLSRPPSRSGCYHLWVLYGPPHWMLFFLLCSVHTLIVHTSAKGIWLNYQPDHVLPLLKTLWWSPFHSGSKPKSSACPLKPYVICLWLILVLVSSCLFLFSPCSSHTDFLAVPQNGQAHSPLRPSVHAIHSARNAVLQNVYMTYSLTVFMS